MNDATKSEQFYHVYVTPQYISLALSLTHFIIMQVWCSKISSLCKF